MGKELLKGQKASGKRKEVGYITPPYLSRGKRKIKAKEN